MNGELFIDRSLSPVDLAEALRAAGLSVVTLRDHYGEAAGRKVTDDTWIREQTALGRALLAADYHVTLNRIEARALYESEAVIFVFPVGSLTVKEQARRVISNWPTMLAHIAQGGPAAYVLYERVVSQVDIHFP